MRAAHRDGKVYRPGDPGFEEAWTANMREAVSAAIRQMDATHAERMKTDPAYRAHHEASMTELERFFAARPGLHGETGGATHGATGA